MKRLIITLLILLSGCAVPQATRSVSIVPAVNEERTAGIGDAFLSYEETSTSTSFMVGEMTIGVHKFDLTVVELNSGEIGLQYAEYTPEYSTSGGLYSTPVTMPTGRWLIKQGFKRVIGVSP